jgi:glycine betaine/proline transport system permease protein
VLLLLSFPEWIVIPFGYYIDLGVKWLVTNWVGFFDALSAGLLFILSQLENLFLWFPWWLFILLIFILGWWLKSFSSGIIYAAMLFLIGAFGLWSEMMLTLALVVASVVISILIGLPLGVLMAYNESSDAIMKPILDGMQTMPSFVYLIPAMMFFGLGKVPALFATIIYAIPPVVRLTNLGIKSVPTEVVEAAESFGPSFWQLLTKVQLPQAMPTIMTGINQTTMMALAMVVISSMVGARGLGYQVLVGINRIDIAIGVEAGLAIVFLAIIIDRLTQGITDRFSYAER